VLSAELPAAVGLTAWAGAAGTLGGDFLGAAAQLEQPVYGLRVGQFLGAAGPLRLGVLNALGLADALIGFGLGPQRQTDAQSPLDRAVFLLGDGAFVAQAAGAFGAVARRVHLRFILGDLLVKPFQLLVENLLAA